MIFQKCGGKDGLCALSLSLSGVWASRLIPKGKRFGPFAGEKKKRSQVTSNVYMWEVGRRGRCQLLSSSSLSVHARGSYGAEPTISAAAFSRALAQMSPMMSTHVCPSGMCKSKPRLLVSPRFISQREAGCAWTPRIP